MTDLRTHKELAKHNMAAANGESEGRGTAYLRYATVHAILELVEAVDQVNRTLERLLADEEQ